MKNLFLITLLIFGINFVNAQEKEDWKIKSANVLSGESPLSSGMAGSINLSRANQSLSCDFNSTLGEALHFYSPDSVKWMSFGYSAGVFKSQIWVPWAGPIVSFNFFKGHLTTLNWAGWSLGNPEDEIFEFSTLFCFSYQQVSLNWKFAEVYYALMHYQKCKPEHIFGTKLTKNICDKVSVFGGVGYMTTAEKYLWSMGINFNFNTKI